MANIIENIREERLRWLGRVDENMELYGSGWTPKDMKTETEAE